MSWHGPESLGGRLFASPVSAVSWQDGRLDIFSVDADDFAPQHWWYDHGWGNNARPESLGGSHRLFASALTAVSWHPGRLDIFGVSRTDATLQHWWFDNGWGNNAQPESLGGALNSPALSAVSWRPGRLDIFGIGAQPGAANDQTLQHWWFDNGWGNNARPESLGGKLIGAALSAVSWRPGRLDIFGIDADDQTLQHWWFDNGWGNNARPESLGGRLSVDAMTAVSWQPGRLDIFGIDNLNATLQHWWFDDGWGNNARPESLGGRLSPLGLDAVSWQPGRLDIFGVGTDATLQHWWFDNGWGNNGAPESLGGRLSPPATFTVSAVSWHPGRLDFFGVDHVDNTLQHWWYF
jgi:hypothetical protein